ncbi:hypothetical protein [Chitinophaga ginsengisoli]|uniref:6-bladed beta-propeller protein n=1 Tax=Chitinophaga ginsengisoli TaxID=363837 RepID=A0A2P8G598_9BACT|nr:hypothetical protein [Chitinophaga ginsengisoli]PSL29065.1 hypothetical protein CLV42_107212 [Chitinophaga ginsengisoli]
MKRDLLILSALLSCAIITTYILAKEAEPDRIFTNYKRNYDSLTLQPIDTVLFPGRVSIMKAALGNIYGYVYSKKTIFRYNTDSHHIDSFYSNNGIVTRLEIDANTFYIFDDREDSLTTYGPGKNTSYYLKTRFDTSKKITQLKLREFSTTLDSTIYEFPRFEDGGLSADGFYISHHQQQYYISFYNSTIIQYDETHKSTQLIYTIDHTPPSNIAVPTGNIYTRSSKSVIVNSTAAADDDHLYVLSYVISQDAVKSNYKGPVVDVYSIQSGQYERSFRFPAYQGKPILQLAKSADTLIAAYENNILLFKLTNK